MNESARRLQLARQYRQSKYVLEHILRPSQLYSGGVWREGSRLHARWRDAAVDAGAEFRITMSEPLVIVGNGMAAACLCEELAQRALGRYAIAVIGEEPRLAYNRVLLSSVLPGEVRAGDLFLKPAAWWSDRGITFG